MGIPAITETIDIDLPLEESRTAWNTYVTRMIVGSGSLLTTPEVLARLRRTEPEGGSVRFAAESHHLTRMTLVLEYAIIEWPRDLPMREEQLHQELSDLLQQFKQFAEKPER